MQKPKKRPVSFSPTSYFVSSFVDRLEAPRKQQSSMADTVRFQSSHRPSPSLTHPDPQVPPPPAQTQPRKTPAEHAQAAFAPQDVPVPPVVLSGPLIASPDSHPSPSHLSPPVPVVDVSSAPNTPSGPPDTLPPPSPPAEAQSVPQGVEIEAVSVQIQLDPEEQKSAEQWNQERVERKMRGEYERAREGLAEIVSCPKSDFPDPSEAKDLSCPPNPTAGGICSPSEGERWTSDGTKNRPVGRFEGSSRGQSLFRSKQSERRTSQEGDADVHPSQINDNLDVPLRLNAIRILGASQTRPSFLSRIFAPYLTSLPPPSFLAASYPPTPSPPTASDATLRSVLKTSQEVVSTLSKFDIFRTLDASIERPSSVLAHPDEVDLVLRVTEAPKYFLRTATDVGDGEGSATATAKVRNVFGGGETLEGNLSFGTRTRNAFQVSFALSPIPFPLSRPLRFPFLSSVPSSPASTYSTTSRRSSSTPPSSPPPPPASTSLSSKRNGTSTSTQVVAKERRG